MTIEECLDIAYSWNTDILSFRTTAGRDRLRAALAALVAQARDEEAAECAWVCEEFDTCDPKYIATTIRARIAARAEDRSHG